jgi:hypothetical protein
MRKSRAKGAGNFMGIDLAGIILRYFEARFQFRMNNWCKYPLVREIIKAKLPKPGGGSTVELVAQRRVLP